MELRDHVLGALIAAAAMAGALWLAQELQSPVSDVRLWLGEIIDNLRGDTT